MYFVIIFNRLQVLSIGGNRLTEVPATVGQLMNLQALILCDNFIESIPSSIANLHQLKSLLLHRNKIRTLPQEIVTLKYLTEVRSFYIQAVPGKICTPKIFSNLGKHSKAL